MQILIEFHFTGTASGDHFTGGRIDPVMDAVEPLKLRSFEDDFLIELRFGVGFADLGKLIGSNLDLRSGQYRDPRIDDTAVPKRQSGDRVGTQ